MKFTQFTVVALFAIVLGVVASADMPDPKGISVNFACDPNGGGLVGGVQVSDLAIHGVSGFTGIWIDGELMITSPRGDIRVGKVDPTTVQCIDEHAFSYYAQVAIANDLVITDERHYMSGCYPNSYNLAGVANWSRDQHVVIGLNGDAFSFDRSLSFGHLEDCQKD